MLLRHISFCSSQIMLVSELRLFMPPDVKNALVVEFPHNKSSSQKKCEMWNVIDFVVCTYSENKFCHIFLDYDKGPSRLEKLAGKLDWPVL